MSFPARWISVRAAGKYLSPHPMTVYKLFHEGRNLGAKVGGAVRIDFKSLEAGLETQVRNRRKGGR